MENEATVSKNFIEQIIEKDLAEGHCCLLYTSWSKLKARVLLETDHVD